MVASRIEGDQHVNGDLSAKTLRVPANTIVNSHISSAAAIAASKMEHRLTKTYSQELDTTSASEERALHIVYGATGDIISFDVGSSTACAGDATITVDLRKNGVTTSLLTAAVVLDTDNTAFIVEGGTIDTAGVVADDVLHVIITTAGTSAVGKGVFCTLQLNEDPA